MLISKGESFVLSLAKICIVKRKKFQWKFRLQVRELGNPGKRKEQIALKNEVIIKTLPLKFFM